MDRQTGYDFVHFGGFLKRERLARNAGIGLPQSDPAAAMTTGIQADFETI